MTKKIPLRIVTPEKVSWEGEVNSIVVPAYEGELGILPGHAPLLTQMSTGAVRINSSEGPRVLAVSGGFVEVLDGKVSVFAETAELAEEIDAERARQAVEKAKAALRHNVGAEIDAQAMAALQRALIRLRVAGKARRHSPGAQDRPPV